MKRVVERQNEMMPVKSLEKCLTHSKDLGNVSFYNYYYLFIVLLLGFY